MAAHRATAPRRRAPPPQPDLGDESRHCYHGAMHSVRAWLRRLGAELRSSARHRGSFLCALLAGLGLAAAGARAAEGEPPTPQTAPLAELALHPKRSATATVLSLNETTRSAEIAAVVTALPVRVGDIAEADSPLAELECADYRIEASRAEARLASLQARLELARKTLARSQRLRAELTVSKQRLDERETEVAALAADRRAAVAARDAARLDTSRCVVRSPFRALVTARLAAVGQYAAVGTPLLRLLDLGELEVSAQVAAPDAVTLGGATVLRFENAGQAYPVRVRTILPAVHTATRTREVRLLFTERSALPGAAGKLRWRDPRPHLPARLIVRRGEVLGVFSIAAGRARFHPLPGAEAGRDAPTSLPPTTRIVVRGQLGLRDGDAVVAERTP